MRNILKAQSPFASYLKPMIGYWLIGCLMLIVGRLAIAFSFLDVEQLCHSMSWLALYNILRFDFQSMAYIAAVPTLVLLTASFLRNRNWTATFCRWYYAILYTLLTLLTISDYCYYKNFRGHFDVTAFDFFDEGPASLVVAFWEEYPVILFLLLTAALCYGIYRIRLVRLPITSRGPWYLIPLWILFLFICMRGSVTSFPLQVEDIYVSANPEMNDCVPNAVYSLKKAWKEKKNVFEMLPEETLLKQHGFTSVEEAREVLGLGNNLPGDPLFAQIPDDSTRVATKRDVVVILSESWSGWFLKMGLDDPSHDLLCGMRSHLEEDLLLSNYQSVQNGTIGSIENLTMATGFARLFMSKYRFTHFPTSFADPFRDSGYETIFLSGIDQGWMNVGSGLQNQGFERIITKYELLETHPEYGFNSIGIYDHHVFQSLNELLEVPADRPRLIFMLTTTNHPPFDYPEEIALPEPDDSYYGNPVFANKIDIQRKYMRGFQYANYSMAQFLTHMKSNPKSAEAIVAITGDHNVRTAIAFGNDAQHAPKDWERRVPFYLYLPQELRRENIPGYGIDREIYGCHYDILPTLITLVGDPGTRYLHVGQNLLDPQLTRDNSYSYNIERVLAAAEYMTTAERKAQARELLLRLYHQQIMQEAKK